MQHLSVDIETYSDLPLNDVGLYRYANSPAFRVLLIGVAVDDGPVRVIDPEKVNDSESRRAVYDDFLHWFQREDVLLHAFNAVFEWYCLGRIGLATPISHWRCTMVHGLYLGYSGGLDAMGAAVGIEEDKQMALRQTPWATGTADKTVRRPWTDADAAGLRWYLETAYGIKGKQTIDDAFTTVANANAYDDVESYICSLRWDGTPRIERMWVKYLGAADSEYTRAVSRKSLVACVARALRPGVKYDTVLTLVGGQGYGKSTVLELLGRKWFNASLASFDRNKEASELIQGSWIVELGELAQLNHSELSAAKQFITRTTDRFRAAYGRYTEDYPRRCVFFGTTNRDDFLRDETGERRFWPLPITRKMQPEDFEEFAGLVDQFWAEAKAYYDLGERLFLDSETLEAAAKVLQEQYREDDGVEGMIRAFLEKPVPPDWYERDVVDRRAWLSARKDFGTGTKEPLVCRDRICAREIWAEMYGKDLAYCDNRQSLAINKALSRLGWISGRYRFGGDYGMQRGYAKPGTVDSMS